MYTVLHVEDDPRILDLTALAIDLSDGISLVQETNGADGILRAEQLKPDLILLDFMMPGLSGEDVIKAIKASDDIGGTPVVFMTARTTIDDYNFFYSLGAVDVISKPFDPLMLPDRIKELIRESKMQLQCA